MRPLLLLAAGAIVLLGLAWNFLPIPLPGTTCHVGGSVLWGAMLLLLVEAGLPRGAPARSGLLVALVLALAVELLRLVHVGPLDRFRSGFVGGLLLGRIFDVRNIACYWLGAALAWAACRRGRSV